MRNVIAATAVLALLSPVAAVAQESEAEFLEKFEGSWSGGGSVKTRIDSPTRNVSCDLQSTAEGGALSMNGTCRAMIIASRRIGAEIRADGASYTGSYVGGGSGTAGLSGQRSGETINFAINWAKDVNGDRRAEMQVASLGEGRMRLRTIDTDPQTGAAVVTSDIELQRN